MKTLILKELRENLKVAAIALLLSIAVVAGSQVYYVKLMEGIQAGVSSPQNYYYRLQPLSSNFEGFSAILCALVGVALGWFQIHNERHRDLWAFLVHRPVTRTTIFLSKTIAGLILYVVTVGLPLGYFVLWVKTPGHVAAPFEWGMAGPTLGGFLTGVAWYFAGMLTSIRQARWYGSRALAVGAALLAIVSAYAGMRLLPALVTMTLAVAAWGAFQNRGQFQGQPVIAKAALTLSVAPGVGMIMVAGTALAMEIFFGVYAVTTWPYYSMGRDGVIYKTTYPNGMPQITSLEGVQLKDPDTGKPMEMEQFNRNFPIGGITATIANKGFPSGPQADRFRLLKGDRHALWFTVNRTGRIEGYDVQTRRFIGSLGPDGFAADEKGDGSRFLPNDQGQLASFRDTVQPMVSTNTIYWLDLENRAVKAQWTITGDDTIEGFSSPAISSLVLTRHAILFFTIPGDRVQPLWRVPLPANMAQPLWRIPFPDSQADYSSVTVYTIFNQTSQPSYCVWIAPHSWRDFFIESKLPTHALWLSRYGEVTNRVDLPPLVLRRNPDTAESVLNSLMPPVVNLSMPWLGNASVSPKIDWHAVGFSFYWGILCVPTGFWLGRRANFSAKRQAIWALFNLFFGLPGLLAFLSVQEWPAREKCASCGKLRVVDHEACEHCGAGFPPPKKNGTEIFEALETV